MKGANYLAIVLIVIGSVISLGFLFWLIQEKKTYNIYILDKTVPNKTYVEHKSFNWILTQQKFVNKKQKIYTPGDYYGFHPENDSVYKIKSLRLYEVLSIPDNLDMVYYTDTYGVTYEDWFKHTPEKLHSPLLYGRLNQNDYLLLSEMKRKNKLILTEFNLLASPTSDLVRQKTETMFGFKWSGWIGSYVRTLRVTNPDLPRWIIVQYEQKYKKKWNFDGHGVILIHHSGDILILEARSHLNDPYPMIISSPYGQKTYNLPETQKYSGWFDIIDPGSVNKVVSTYKIDVNPDGLALLKQAGIPSEFPAIIEHLETYKFYYFAGDFADREFFMGSAYFKGVPALARVFAFKSSETKSTFFWRFYEPLISNILKNNLVAASHRP